MSLQTRLLALVSAIGTDIKALTAAVAQAERRAVLAPDTDFSTGVEEANAVVWKRASDGAFVAYKHVQQQGSAPNRSYTESDFVDAEGTGSASLSQQARVPIGGYQRAALFTLTATQALRSIRAQAESDSGTLYEKLIIDSDGKSDFSGPFVFLDTPVLKVTNGSGNAALTVVDISSDTGSDTAKFAILRVLLQGIGSSPFYVENIYEFRANGKAGPQVKSRHQVGGNGMGGGIERQVIVPLDANERFQYQKFDGVNSSSGGTITLEGYIK